MIRLGILGSTRGTDMLALISAIQEKKLSASIEIVISNKPDAIILQRAKENNLNACFANPNEISAILKAHGIQLIVLIGYMKILSPEFISAWRNKVINVHPSLLPAFSGGMDKNVHQAVLDAGVKETGCTVHIVTEEVDAGPILIQKKCLVLLDDTSERLKTRVQKLEGEALIEAITLMEKKINEPR